MKYAILGLIAVMCIAASPVYEIDFDVNTQTISRVSLALASLPDEWRPAPHSIEVLGARGEVLTQRPVLLTPECLFGDCTDVMIIHVPYHNRGVELVIRGDTDVLRYDVRRYNNYCGDGVCSVGDTASSCPEDCLIRIEEQADSHTLLWGALIGLILFLLVLLVIKFRKKPAAPQYVSEY